MAVGHSDECPILWLAVGLRFLWTFCIGIALLCYENPQYSLMKWRTYLFKQIFSKPYQNSCA